jgi:glycosyltransferase involved in cell wall biosynthesis
MRILEWSGVREADGIIVTTEALARHIARWVPRQKIYLIPNGVDTARFVPVARGARGREGVRHLLFVGRLVPQKNLTILLLALEELARDCRVDLTIIGTGPEERNLRAMAAAKSLPVEFVGRVPHGELPRFFGHADVFVLPSRWEGHPKALLEAMSAGLACVVSNIEGNRSLITDRSTGLLVEPDNPVALASAIRLVLNDDSLRQRLGQAARMQALKQYDLHRLLQREVALVRETMLRAQEGTSSNRGAKEPPG